MENLRKRIEITRENLLDIIFKFDIASYRELLILRDEVKELFDYRETLEDIRNDIENYSRDYIEGYLARAESKARVIYGSCSSRLKRVKLDPLNFFDGEVPDVIKNMKI